jgi:hypothetical protein
MGFQSLRRAIAVVLLVMTSASGAESVFGVLRDGEMHHVSAAAAVTHRNADPQSGQGQEDSQPTHQHGTPADHCTHAHGVAIINPAFHFSAGTSISTQHLADPAIHTGRSSLDEFHPPRV